MKIERDKVYLTRCGDKVRVICTDLKDTQPVVGLHLRPDGMECVECFYASGSYFAGSDDCRLDLVSEYVEPPKPREVWVFEYPDGLGCTIYQADLSGNGVKTVKFREVIEA